MSYAILHNMHNCTRKHCPTTEKCAQVVCTTWVSQNLIAVCFLNADCYTMCFEYCKHTKLCVCTCCFHGYITLMHILCSQTTHSFTVTGECQLSLSSNLFKSATCWYAMIPPVLLHRCPRLRHVESGMWYRTWHSSIVHAICTSVLSPASCFVAFRTSFRLTIPPPIERRMACGAHESHLNVDPLVST